MPPAKKHITSSVRPWGEAEIRPSTDCKRISFYRAECERAEHAPIAVPHESHRTARRPRGGTLASSSGRQVDCTLGAVIGRARMYEPGAPPSNNSGLQLWRLPTVSRTFT